MNDLEIHPVTPERWADLVELFERRGPRGGTPIVGSCWCMGHRDEDALPRTEMRKDAMRGLVAGGKRPGLLAYSNGVPIGWVAVAPRSEYGQLQRSRLYGPLPGDEGVYAVTCFYIDPRHRSEGVASALLDAAIEFARECGASALDGFPKVKLAEHATRNEGAEAGFSFMGRPSSFERRNFRVVKVAGSRAVVRRVFDAPSRGSTND